MLVFFSEGRARKARLVPAAATFPARYVMIADMREFLGELFHNVVRRIVRYKISGDKEYDPRPYMRETAAVADEIYYTGFRRYFIFAQESDEVQSVYLRLARVQRYNFFISESAFFRFFSSVDLLLYFQSVCKYSNHFINP